MLVFIWYLLLNTLRWVTMCQGFNHFSVLLHHCVFAKLATNSIQVSLNTTSMFSIWIFFGQIMHHITGYFLEVFFTVCTYLLGDVHLSQLKRELFFIIYCWHIMIYLFHCAFVNERLFVKRRFVLYGVTYKWYSKIYPIKIQYIKKLWRKKAKYTMRPLQVWAH